MKWCLPVASWDLTVARSAALSISEDMNVIKDRYTFVFTQRCIISAVKQGMLCYVIW